MENGTVLVIGGTGKTGRRVVRMLREQRVSTRAASRTGDTLFDWSAPDTWGPALLDVVAVYVVHPELGSPDATEQIQAFATLAAASGVSRATLLSVPGAGGMAPDEVLAAEHAVSESGLATTILRVRWFFQNFNEDFLLDPVLSGELRLPAGNGAEGFIDADDIAAVAVATLLEDGHARQTYELTGPRLMTFSDLADDLTTATGRPLVYVPLSQEDFVEEQLAAGAPPEWADLLATMYAGVRTGNLATLSDDVERVLGRPATDFRTFAKNAAAEGAWAR